MSEVLTDQFPALQGRRRPLIDYAKLEEVHRILCRAFQDGVLSEDELASTLDRLAGGSVMPYPTPHQYRHGDDLRQR